VIALCRDCHRDHHKALTLRAIRATEHAPLAVSVGGRAETSDGVSTCARCCGILDTTSAALFFAVVLGGILSRTGGALVPSVFAGEAEKRFVAETLNGESGLTGSAGRTRPRGVRSRHVRNVIAFGDDRLSGTLQSV
jgi:hypothetical protein